MVSARTDEYHRERGSDAGRPLHRQGHQVTVLSRAPKPAPWRVVLWDARTDGAWTSALEESDVCINLTGRSVNCRYYGENRREMYDSRIDSTRLLNNVITSLKQPPRLWLNASTATIYRHAQHRDHLIANLVPLRFRRQGVANRDYP